MEIEQAAAQTSALPSMNAVSLHFFAHAEVYEEHEWQFGIEVSHMAETVLTVDLRKNLLFGVDSECYVADVRPFNVPDTRRRRS